MQHLLPNMSPRWKSRWVFLDIYLFVLVEKASDWPLTKDYREIHWLSQGMPLWALGEVCPVGLPFTSINPIYWLLTYKGYNHVTGATRNIYPGGPKKEKKKAENPFLRKLISPILGSSVLNLTQQRNRTVAQFVSCSPATWQPRGQVHPPHYRGLCSDPSILIEDSESSQRILGTTGTNPHVFHNVTLNICWWLFLRENTHVHTCKYTSYQIK